VHYINTDIFSGFEYFRSYIFDHNETKHESRTSTILAAVFSIKIFVFQLQRNRLHHNKVEMKNNCCAILFSVLRT